jgi:hypothetical protein
MSSPVLVSLVIISLGLAIQPPPIPQSADDTRGLKPVEYAKQLHNRIAGTRPRSNRSGKAAATNYVPAAPDSSTVEEGVDVGVTFWRLREVRKVDNLAVVEPTRIVKRVKGKAVEFDKAIPERAHSEAPWSDGEKFRLSIEVPFECFIYIINQERYADGSLSEPYLVFPSKGDLARNAKAISGKLVYFPNEQDCFEIASLAESGRTKVAEVFSILLSPNTIDELPPLADQEEKRRVQPALFERLLSDWRARTWKFENMGALGTSITSIEKKASTGNAEVLTDRDPEPQSVYHVARKRGNSLAITVPIRINN